FFITAPDLPGVAVFLVDNTGPEPVLYLNGDLIAAGSITASHLNVATLSAIVANLGEVIAGILRNSANTFRVDATNGYLLISSS
ncbi:hypothetical protein EJ105_27570, partial [Xanthobacter aminoxidans]|uniref:hypothetical protein n=1 Tax=Xanthobacter aminoxidans TaxID=186280 RepID=UPI002022EEB0